MGALTDQTNTPPAVASFFSKKLLFRARPKLVFNRVAQRRPLKMKSGNTMVFRRYERLATAKAPLTEGVTPSGTVPTHTDISATIQQYGNYTYLADLTDATVDSPVLNEWTDIYSENSADTLDELLRDTANATTTVFFGGNAANRAALATRAHMIEGSILDRVTRFLDNQNAKRFTAIISAGLKQQTFPIRPAYWGICHPDVHFTLQELQGWVPVEQYASSGRVMEAEVGAYKNLRFLETTQQQIIADGGGAHGGADVKSTSGTDADVYMTTIFAMEAIGVIPLDGMSLQNIIHAKGNAGVADPLNQRGSIGWKATQARARLNDNFMAKIESTAGNIAP